MSNSLLQIIYLFCIKIKATTMKVSELYIKKYHQFEDFTLNLTYPEGHKLAGQPLNKVCFIGQSGTGKTTLINILRRMIEVLLTNGYSNDFTGSYIVPQRSHKDFFGIKNEEIVIKFYNLNSNESIKRLPILPFPQVHYSQLNFIEIQPSISLFYFPCDIQLPKISNSEEKIVTDIDVKPFYRIIDFENYDINQIWKIINETIIEDRELEIKKSLDISKLLRDRKTSKDVIDKATENFRKWREETPNPIQDLADNYLDKIIGRFNLKVKTELDFEKKEDIETIKIQQKNGKEIPFEALSTGTKQVILTALPLYGLKPKDSIILFDEPERSLYPDIQTEIVDFYTSMAENSQFFFATHSPLVAASFEPWEIVELKFNEETGNVEQELYYDETKGRHVDNYTIYPQYLTYDGILKRVFDMKKEPNNLRMNELVKLATLESQLKHNDLSPEAKKEKFEEIIKLADQLDWDLK
jgi:ABC-type lipoprotein export system ATPase subunit